MIEKMNLVHVVGVEQKKEEMLDALRDLGLLHISEKSSPDESVAQRLSSLQKLSAVLSEYAFEDEQCDTELGGEEFEELFRETENAIKRKAILEESRSNKLIQIERLKDWGDFSPREIIGLQKSGLDIHFYKVDKKILKTLSEEKDIKFIKLSVIDKLQTVAVIGNPGSEYASFEFTLPEKGISELEEDISVCEKEISYFEKTLHKSACQLEAYKRNLINAQDEVEYSSVKNTAKSDMGLVWLKGYIPISETEKFIECAKENKWAYTIEAVDVDDGFVPTKVKYNKLTGLMKPVFDILGTVPGYREYDISFWFFAFFTLFFAMIIGDAGYGAIFLIGTIVAVIKAKKFTNATLLLTVLSVATVVWGAITGTWFGLESAMKVPLLKALVIPQFANYPQYFGVETTSVQNTVMKFCFSIGVIQLALACVMNIKRKISLKDLSFVADLGWLISISSLYFLVLYLVIGESVNLKAIAILVGAGFLLVVLFGGMSPDKSFIKGLASGLSDIFTVFLNTISAFGNVMSYIRLFAVGMASVAIAQSFNNMASNFHGALIIVAALIMIIGHLMNIVMGFLSVAVHGIRLNLLEFSGQLGMEWSGTAYEPFKKTNGSQK